MQKICVNSNMGAGLYGFSVLSAMQKGRAPNTRWYANSPKSVFRLSGIVGDAYVAKKKNQRPCFEKTATRLSLPMAPMLRMHIQPLYRANDGYVADIDNKPPFLYKKDEISNLLSGDAGGVCISVFAEGSDLYVAGKSNDLPVFCKNTQKIDLPKTLKK